MTASAGDRAAFEELVAPYRGELQAHCYRMLGSVQDAEDALQEALIGAWRGRAGFEGRGSWRGWLYKIATNACLQVIARRPRRRLVEEHAPEAARGTQLEPMVHEPIWLEPYPDDPRARYEEREALELAFVAALQHLPGTQRAAVILHEVVGLAAAEIAELLETTSAAVNSALQRGRATLAARRPGKSQQATLRELGEPAQRELVAAFVGAWDRGDVAGLVALLARDAKFTMPPFPTWFEGRDAIGRFVGERVFATPWRAAPMRANGQLAFALWQGHGDGQGFRLSAINVVALRGAEISELTGFLDPAVHARFEIPGAR